MKWDVFLIIMMGSNDDNHKQNMLTMKLWVKHSDGKCNVRMAKLYEINYEYFLYR